MKDYKRIEHMRNLNGSLIWERMKRCYDFGYEDGKADTPFTDTEEAEKKAYNRGLSDAWELVKRIESTPEDGGLTNKQIVEVFGQYWSSFELYRAFSVEEAMDLMQVYEDKQKQDAEIKVGDEIVCEDAHVVITYISPINEWNGFLLNSCERGKRGQGYTLMNGFKGWQKTGRHFDQIAEVLAELRGAENDE